MSLDVVEDDWILLRIMKRIGGAVGVMEAREGEWEGVLHVLWWMGFDVYVYLRRGVEEATRKKEGCFCYIAENLDFFPVGLV